MNENNNKTDPEPLSAIFAELRAAVHDSFASKLIAQYEETGRLDEISAVQALKDDDAYFSSLADRIEAAVDRMRDAYCDLCKEKDEAYDRLLLEHDKAIKANNGNVAVLRSALLIILDDARKLCKMDRDATAKICKDALAAIEKPAQETDK